MMIPGRDFGVAGIMAMTSTIESVVMMMTRLMPNRDLQSNLIAASVIHRSIRSIMLPVDITG